MSLFAELKRRNVFKVGIAYVLMGWVLLQGADFVLDLIGAPDWVIRVFSLAVIIGLPIALFFAWAFELTPEGLKREHEVDRTQSITPKTGRKLDFIIIGFLAVAVGYLLFDKFYLTQPSSGEVASAESTDTAPADTVTETSRKSIAVLPFANMSEDASNEYFSDGISEEILNSLARVKELKVAGRTSSFAFKGRNEDLRMIGETLGVEHILEGSVRKAGNKVRITAQLVKVDDGFHLWSDTYDRELTDIFTIQDEIAGSILKELKAELIGDRTIASTRTDAATYEKYLLARQRIYTRDVPEMRSALQLLDEVIAEDPEFAPAWAQRGIVTMLLSDTEYGDIPNEQAQAEGKRFAEHAIALDDELAEAWGALGLHYARTVGSQEATGKAIEALERALALNPNLINASNWLQQGLHGQGRAREAQAILESMFERDPLYPPLMANLTFNYVRMGQLDKAEAVLDLVRPFYAGQHNLASSESIVRYWSGRQAEALEFSEQALALAPTNQTTQSVYSFALFGLGEYEAASQTDMTDPFLRVFALQMLDRKEEALIEAREWARQDPSTYMSLLADQGRFVELVDYYDAGWDNLEALNADFPNFGFGAWLLLDMAWAFAETDREPQFEEAMRLARAEQDLQIEQGADNQFFWLSEAEYWVHAGDYARAVEFLGRSVNQGHTSADIAREVPVFQRLASEPAFRALRQRGLDQLNRQRELAGLEPLNAEFSL